MCSFLLIFLIVIVLFTAFHDFAQQEHLSPQSAERPSESSTILVPTQKRPHCTQSGCFTENQESVEPTPQPRSEFHRPHSGSNGSGTRGFRVLPMALPMWASEQKVCGDMCDLLCTVACRHETQNATESLQLVERCPRLGRLGRRVKLGIQSFWESSIFQIQAGCSGRQCLWLPASPTTGESGQRSGKRPWERKERYQEGSSTKPRGPTGTGVTVPERRRICTLGSYGLFKVYAIYSAAIQPFCYADAHEFGQRQARVDGSSEKGISRPSYDAGRYQTAFGEGGAGDRENGHQKPTSGYQIPWQGKETPRRGYRTEEVSSIPLDGPSVQWYPDVGEAIRGLPKTSGDVNGTSWQSKDGNFCNKQDHTTIGQHSGGGSGTFHAASSNRSGRGHRGSCRQRGGSPQEAVARSSPELRNITWSGSDPKEARRLHRGDRRGGGRQAVKATAIYGTIWWCCQSIVTDGRVKEVLKNSLHEATTVQSVASIADAYQWTSGSHNAACSCWDAFATANLPWTHTIMNETRYASPFQAVLNAIDLQWEVGNDLVCNHPSLVYLNPILQSISQPLMSSQRSHADTARRHVRFENHIDVYIGDDDDFEMSCLQVSQEAIWNWDMKPWSRKRIRKSRFTNPQTENFSGQIVSLEPLSEQAVLSRDSIKHHARIQPSGQDENENHDVVVLMQRHMPRPSTCKTSPYEGNEASLMEAFQQGHARATEDADSTEGNSDMSEAESSPNVDSNADALVQQQEEHIYRQDVILYHLHDLPIRVLLNWNGYEEMMLEIAHHYAVDRAQLLEAYEVAAQLPDLDENVVPIVVHMRNDFPLSHQAKLALVDVELHGNKVEDHFQQGPLTTRQVLVTPALVSRHGLLRVAEVDRYCTSENDRCLVFHNSHRWPDYDERARLISHADYVRIAVPPSEGFACPTRDLVQMRQDGFTDAEMLDVIYNDEVISGYSPSLLGDEDVAALATPHVRAEGDHFLALQTTLGPHRMHGEGVKTAVPEQLEGSIDCFEVLSHDDSTCPAKFASSPMKPVASLTDEFLQAVEAARNAGEEVPPPIDPLAIEAQPQAFQDIWASSTTLIEFGPVQPTEFLRVESWYLNHVNFHRCHTSRITLLNADYVRWKEQLAATWNDKITNVNDLSFALVSPLPEDCATNIVAQLIITERESSELRSAVLSVYDSEEEMERNPHTFAIVLRRRLNLVRLTETLHLQMDCPPVNIRNLCSLWFGTVPIGPSHEVNLQAGNAFRLVVSRGVFLDIPSILTLEDTQIRRVLQRAIHTEIYDRPPDPSFLAYGQSDIANGSSWLETGVSSDGRPPWIPILERHLQTGLVQQNEDASVTFTVVTWYLNSDAHFHCDFPRTVSLTDESFMWRTDCIFPWRDRWMRGAVAEPIALNHPLPTAVSDDLFPHVIVVQGLTDEQCAVIISVQGTDGLTLSRRQFAHVFPGRASGRDIIRLAVPEEHKHRPVIIRMRGQTYFPDDTLAISSGTPLSVLISGTTIDIYTEEHADGFSLMQHNATYAAAPVMCKPAGFGMPDDFPVSIVSSHVQRPPRPYHDGLMEWSETLHRVFLESGERNLWNDDVTLQVTTWFIHHENRPVCHRPRFLRLTDNPITWIEDLRTAWENLLDPRQPFTILLVQPNPPQFRAHSTACHIILEQARTDQQAAVLFTALLEGFSQDGMIQGAYSVHTRVNCASIIRTMEISFQCADRPCTLFHRRQPFSSDEWVDVHSGVSLYIRLSAPRSATGDQELEPAFFQHFEDLTLMQTQLVGSNPLVREGRHGRSQVLAQPKHIQDLFACLENSTFVGEEESRALHVLTWFVAPGAGVFRCMNSRKVTLLADFRQWEGQLKANWTPLLDSRLPTTIVVAYPAQPHLEPSIGAHVLLLQQERTNWSSPIITICDSARNHGIPFQVVTTVPQQSAPNDILASLDNLHIQGAHCQVWQEGYLMAAARHDIDHGVNLQVHIYQQTVHPWNELEQDSDESVQMQHGLSQSSPQPLSAHASGNSDETGASGCAAFSFNVNATEFIPSQPSVSTLPEYLPCGIVMPGHGRMKCAKPVCKHGILARATISSGVVSVGKYIFSKTICSGSKI